MQHKPTLLIIVPRNLREQFLGALIEAYNENEIQLRFWEYEGSPPVSSEINARLEGIHAVLFFFPGNRAPGTIIDQLFLKNESGQKIPIGIVPIKKNLPQFIQTATIAQLRKKETVSLALLSQRHPRYVRVSDRMEHIFQTRTQKLDYFKWTSDITFREDMVAGLGSGLGIAIYMGHGRPSGWVGYYGLRAHHFPNSDQPLGALISLCCHTASRRRIGCSFTEQMVLNGIAASGLGAITATLHTNNTRWAVHLAEVLSQEDSRISHIGELLVKASPMNAAANDAYRLVGDPLAPIYSLKAGTRLAQTIQTYP